MAGPELQDLSHRRTPRRGRLDRPVPLVDQHWGAQAESPEAYAVNPLSAPASTRHLRMTNMKTRDSVIIEIARDRLLANANSPEFGWIGAADFFVGSYHLGIYSKTNIQRGQICLHEPIRENFRGGWGFGHVGWIDGQPQGYSWADQKIDPTVFEIAVKTTPLTLAERKNLLKN